MEGQIKVLCQQTHCLLLLTVEREGELINTRESEKDKDQGNCSNMVCWKGPLFNKTGLLSSQPLQVFTHAEPLKNGNGHAGTGCDGAINVYLFI